MNEIIRADHLYKRYVLHRGLFQDKKSFDVLNDISLSICKGEVFGVVGESGCGKSTLGRCMLRLTETTRGNIVFKGSNITNYNRRQMKRLRGQMQMVFQNPLSSFDPMRTIGQAIREIGSVNGIPEAEINKKTVELLECISLSGDLLKRKPSELSGGQLQRLAIARALLLEPDFIVADEPVSALDVSVQAQILNLILDLREKLGLTMMFISHDLTTVEYLCDKVAVMYLGTIVEQASASELFSNTCHPYTQALVAAKLKQRPDSTKKGVILKGDLHNVPDTAVGCRFASRCSKFQKGLCDVQTPSLKEIIPGHFVACHNTH